jgi:hypothetical protein
MSLPQLNNIDDPDRLPLARRRRARCWPRTDERGILDEFAHRLPTFDFFCFLWLRGVLGIGVLLDAPALPVLGAIPAPLMAPAVGICSER